MRNRRNLVIGMITIVCLLAISSTAFAANSTQIPEGFTGIYTAEDLDKIRDDVDGNYILMNDIVFESSDFQEGGAFYNDGAGWIPIGSAEVFFTGVLDGNGHTIQNLTITSDTPGAYGLFKYNKGTIKNLGMVNLSIDVEVTETEDSGTTFMNAGGIVGVNKGTISACYTTGELSNRAKVDELGTGTGGIAGSNLGTIENCYNAASVFASRSYRYSYSHAGGIAATTKGGTIKHCYNIGMVSVGFKGYFASTAYGIAEARNTDTGKCYSIDYVQRERRTSKHYDASYISDEKMRTASTFEGFDFDNTWIMDASSGYPYPQLRSAKHTLVSDPDSTFETGSGTPNDPYIIKTAQQLQSINDHLGAYYRLDKDIDLSTYEASWQSIGSSKYDAFFGVFDGNGHVVKNINIDEYCETGKLTGIFGYNDGVITDLGAVNGTIRISINITEESTSQDEDKQFYLGGISAVNGGVIERCYNTNKVIFEDPDSPIRCNAYIGGICGNSTTYGSVKDCYNNGYIYGLTRRGISVTSGICGNYGTLKNCYNVGKVIMKDGTSAEAMSIGGTSSECINCYTLPIGTAKNYENFNNVVFVEEGQMMVEQTFVGFDFESIWTFDKTNEYKCPVLKSTEHIDFEENFIEFSGGRGLWYSPYIIKTVDELRNIEQYPSDCFVLEADLSLAGEDWKPICSSTDNQFNGRFDGGGHTISGLNIVVDAGEEYAGLFGYTSGKINNIIIKDSVITLGEEFAGKVHAGAIAGYQTGLGEISKCRIVNTDITIITESAETHPYIGGSVGYNVGTIKDVSFDGILDIDLIGTTYGVVGGITGINDDGEISSCYNAAPIAGYIDKTTASNLYWGGIAGINRGTVTDVFNTADILIEKGSEFPSFPRIAGIISKNDPLRLQILSNAYNTGKVKYGSSLETPIASGEKYEAKNTYYTFGKYSSDYNGTKLTEEELKNPGSLAGFDFDAVWMISEKEGEYPYPQLRSIPYGSEEINKSLTDSYVAYEDLYAHTYNEIKPEADVFYDKELLTEGVDYEVTYENNIDPGEGSMIFTGKGQYVGTKTVSFTIKDYDISHMDVKLGNTVLTYTGGERKPQVLIDGLYEGSNFTVTFEDNVNVGTAKAIIEGKGKYFGTVVKTFEIVPDQVKSSSIVIPAKSFSYTGEPIEPEVSIYKMTKDKDYTVTYSNNINIGTATITIEGMGNYTGVASKDFIIEPADASGYDAALSTINYTYNGYRKTPAVTVTTPGGDVLTKDIDYTVGYPAANYKIGKHIVTIEFIGNYTGSQTLPFEIGPKNPSKISSVLYGHDDIKVSWTKVTGAGGYKIYYKKSTSSKYTHLRTTTLNYCKAANLTDGAKYDFKVVAYKKIDGNTCENAGKLISRYTLKKISVPTVVKSGTKVKVKWKNINGETGYQISQSTSKSKTNIVATYKTAIGNYKTVKATKGKKYYYKVRAYNSSSGKKVYGPWSEVKAYRR